MPARMGAGLGKGGGFGGTLWKRGSLLSWVGCDGRLRWQADPAEWAAGRGSNGVAGRSEVVSCDIGTSMGKLVAGSHAGGGGAGGGANPGFGLRDCSGLKSCAGP